MLLVHGVTSHNISLEIGSRGISQQSALVQIRHLLVCCCLEVTLKLWEGKG